MEPLLSLHNVVVRTPERETVGPINWEIERPSRIWLDYARADHLAALVGLLTGKVQPVQGKMREMRTVQVQTDDHLRSILNPRSSIAEYLHAPDAPEYVWLEQRRRSVGVLLEKLGLSPHQFRRALKLQPPEVFERYLALRFIASRSDVLIGTAIWVSPDPRIRETLAQRWLDFPGVVIVAGAAAALPGPVQFHARLGAAGDFTVGPAASPATTAPSLEGSGPGGGAG